MTRRLLFLLPVAALLGLAAIFAALLTDRERDPRIVPSPLVGQPAPRLALPPLAGAGQRPGFDPAAFAGRPLLVNVFASWCVPCLAEHPLLTRLAADGHRVWGIDYRDKAEDVAAWLARHGNPYERIGADPDGRAAVEWGITGVPETFVVDAAGIVRLRHAGPLTEAIVARDILPALQGAAR
ncbi:MAG: DsbE family thiol:disulfide interchange protein [Alphaproteobacteria bacterium]